MIYIDKNQLDLEQVVIIFGDKTKANICVSSNSNQITLQSLKSDLIKKIGESVVDDEYNKSPKVILEIDSIESADVLIKHLEKIKNYLTTGVYPPYCFAC